MLINYVTSKRKMSKTERFYLLPSRSDYLTLELYPKNPYRQNLFEICLKVCLIQHFGRFQRDNILLNLWNSYRGKYFFFQKYYIQKNLCEALKSSYQHIFLGWDIAFVQWWSNHWTPRLSPIEKIRFVGKFSPFCIWKTWNKIFF